MSSGGRLTVLLCAGTLLLTACGGDGGKFAYLFGEPGTSGAPSAPAEAPYTPDYPVAEYDKETIQVFQNLRQLDPCAMFDLEVVKKVAGGPELNSITPGDDLGECTVSAGKSDLAETWTFKVTLGAVIGTEPPETIGDVQFQKFAPRPESCQYLTQVGKAHGLALQATWNGTKTELPKPACDVAKQYVTDTVARWKTPPKRSENKTTPALPLATMDPCMAAKTLLNGAEGRVRLSTPHKCVVMPKSAPAKDKTTPTSDIDIALTFGNDPVQQIPVNPTSYKAAQIKGKPAAVAQSSSNCRITVQYSPDTLVKVDEAKPDEPARNQVIEIRTGTCEAANAAAETIVGRFLDVKVPPAGQPAPGALNLGDLNPPATWQEVGAPADPCTVVGWDAFPPEARNAKGTKPTRRPPEKDSVFKAACRFETGGAEVTTGSADKPASSKLSIMIALVVWGDDASGLSADPAKRKGSVAKQYSGKPGLELAGTSANGDPECLGIVQTAKGSWGISVTNAQFPNVQPCAVSTSVLTAIAAKMS